MKIKSLCIVLLIVFLTACGGTTPVRVDTNNDSAPTVMGLDYRDFEEAAAKMVQSMLISPATAHPQGGRYILAISRITNDTMQRIDTDQLIKKIRVELLNSGRMLVTTAVGANGPEDSMSYGARELRGNDEFNQSTVQKKRTLIAPDMSLSGKIIQINHSISSSKIQVDYMFQLTLTDIKTGLAYWEGEEIIIKRGSGKTVTW
ncbi:MAG: hypothetical protein ACJA1S_000957 [Cellvibrionaceae bacterium]|jgi:uncharacterized protein (TIGR02722 family)